MSSDSVHLDGDEGEEVVDEAEGEEVQVGVETEAGAPLAWSF